MKDFHRWKLSFGIHLTFLTSFDPYLSTLGHLIWSFFGLSTCTAFEFHWELMLNIVQEKLMVFILIRDT